MSKRNIPGFTLLEILLVISFLAFLFGIMAPVYNHFQTRNNLDLAAQTLVQSYRRAQVLAKSMKYDSSWGVYASATTSTIFKGNSYASRDSSYDEIRPFPGNVIASNTTEIIFLKSTSTPTSVATTTLKTPDNEIRYIYINAQGTIYY